MKFLAGWTAGLVTAMVGMYALVQAEIWWGEYLYHERTDNYPGAKR